MKLKLTATIKKEALLPGMEMAIQDVDLQKELNKPGIVQQVNESDQAIDRLILKYPFKGVWDAAELEKDLKSFMKKFYPNTPYGIGVGGPNPLNDKMWQKTLAIEDGQKKAKNESAWGRLFFYEPEGGNIYVLVY